MVTKIAVSSSHSCRRGASLPALTTPDSTSSSSAQTEARKPSSDRVDPFLPSAFLLITSSCAPSPPGNWACAPPRTRAQRCGDHVESQASLSGRKGVVGELEGDKGSCLGCKRQHRRIVIRKVIAPEVGPV